MNAPFNASSADAVESLLMDIARRVQLSPIKHEEAERHFKALCEYVDRQTGPLAGKVVRCYPSGSFAVGAAILSHVSTDQHDVDVVIELDFPVNTQPRTLLDFLYETINGPQGSRYHGRVKLNSRCVTVVYENGTTVDLMPMVRFGTPPERAGQIFHFKPESGQEYHKSVNPWGFAEHFNNQTVLMEEFAKAFRASSSLAMDKAATEPLPDHVPLSEKSPRVVALQLAKRARDVAYRKQTRKGRRKPPSVVMAALALELGPVKPKLTDELLALIGHMERRISQATHLGLKFELWNPTYSVDLFTDRWPEDLQAQEDFVLDLRELRRVLNGMRGDATSPEKVKAELQRIFGETAAVYAMDQYLRKQEQVASSGNMRFQRSGRILAGSSITATAATTAARASTFAGGEKLPE